MRTALLYLTLAALLTLTGAGYAAFRDDAPSSGPQATAAAAGKGAKSLRIKGSVAGLQPGMTTRMQLRIRNRTSKPIVVRKIKTRVFYAGSGCGATNLRVLKRKLRLRVPAHKKRKTWASVAMAADAPDVCQNVTFPLRFKAKSRGPMP
jgi:hypothetical protein